MLEHRAAPALETAIRERQRHIPLWRSSPVDFALDSASPLQNIDDGK